jgi:hypothetical protein
MGPSSSGKGATAPWACPRLGCHPLCPASPYGLLAGPRFCPRGVLAHLCTLVWASFYFSLALLWAKCDLVFLLLFWPVCGVFSYKPRKTSETPKLVEYISWKPYLLSLVWFLYESWWYKLCNKDHQHAPPHLVLWSSSSEGMKDCWR